MLVNCSERKKPPTSSTARIDAVRRVGLEQRDRGQRRRALSDGVADQHAAEAEAAQDRLAAIFMRERAERRGEGEQARLRRR